MSGRPFPVTTLDWVGPRGIARAAVGLVLLCPGLIMGAGAAGVRANDDRASHALHVFQSGRSDGGTKDTATSGDTTRAWAPPVPPASRDRASERLRMVRAQIELSDGYRAGVSDPRVLAAMRTVPRHVFVPEGIRDRAYDDTPLPIGEGQTISQPYIVAVMTELLRVLPDSRVLEIGTGSGYQAAVLAHLTPHVYTIEIIPALAERARTALDQQGYTSVNVRSADGYFGWASEAPFDGIIVTCAAGHLPPPLWDQLAPGGRIVIPIGGPFSVQRLVVIEKTPDGKRRSESVMGVRFVPMTGRAEEALEE